MARKIVVICIGSDRVAGDMLGPLVGSSLRDEYRLPCPVYGWVGESVNGVNLESYLAMIGARHPGSTIIAVDAALGKEGDVGTVRLKKGGIKAGGALERRGERIGDLGVTLTETEEDKDLVLMYAAWLWRSRTTGEGMPQMLKSTLYNRLFGEKARIP